MTADRRESPGGISISIIIEWENVRLSEMERCRSMLRTLAAQIPALYDPAPPAASRAGAPSGDVEILVLYDADEFSGVDIERTVTAEIPPSTPHCRWSVSPGGNGGYYGLKNVGAERARGDLLVFVDSDVIPEAGWLESLIAPFSDPSLQVVAGHTYIEPRDLLSRTIALTWFFPLRSETPSVAPAKGFYANSVAFRRVCFLSHPYKPIPGAARGACRLLARELNAAGVPMVVNTAAQAAHPPPTGWKRFLIRALVQGRDDLFFNRSPQRAGKGTIFHSIARVIQWQLRAIRRILFQHRKVGLPFWQIPAALLAASAYACLLFSGDLATRISPRRMIAAFKM